MQQIVPCIWFDRTAAEAADFYARVFPDGRVLDTQYYPTEGLADFQADLAGQALVVDFELGGCHFTAINAGPEFRPNPSVSFMVNFDASDDDAEARLDELWAALLDGGQALMPLQEYDFSPHYGWVQDRYGVSWQLMLVASGGPRPLIVPSLMFGDAIFGRAAEAIELYTSVLAGQVGSVARYPEQAGAAAGMVMFADFQLLGQSFAAMDAAGQDFTFTCGVSLMVRCADQAEIDRYWESLSAVAEAEQCGWCADRFGLSWQIVPANLGELMTAPDAYQKLMGMKKIEIDAFTGP